METPANLGHSIQKGDWVISEDFTDAYLHVAIHPSSRFWVLPFGLSVSPRQQMRWWLMFDPWACRFTTTWRTCSEEPAVVSPQDSNPRPSSLNNPPGLDAQCGEVKVDTDPGLIFSPAVRF